MVITKFAAKKVQRFQTVKCFDCIHLLMQKRTSTEPKEMGEVSVFEIEPCLQI